MIDSLRCSSRTALRLLWSVFFLLTSVYFFLAYIPYTNFFLIQAPPYHWLTWFSRHHVILFWMALAAGLVGFSDSWERRVLRIGFALQAATGVWLTFSSALERAGSNWTSYAWSLGILVPFVAVQSVTLRRDTSEKSSETPSFSLRSGLIAGAIVALFSAGGVVVRSYVETRRYTVTGDQMDMLLWMLAAHLCLAAFAVCVLNLALAVIAKVVNKNFAQRRSICLLLGILSLSVAFCEYLGHVLSFGGWQLYGFVVPFSVAIACSVAGVLWPLQDEYEKQRKEHRFVANVIVLALIAVAAVSALVVPALLGDADWNGILHCSFNALFWLVVATTVYLMRPCRQQYSIYAVVAVALIFGSAYSGLEMSSIVWAKELGQTPDEIQGAVRSYGEQNSSFGMIYEILHPQAVERCQGLCRILRQCTNLRDTVAKRDLNLVANLQRTDGPRPNVFVIVVDSMRPDYLGAYNPKVDFSPNLDQFARESIVMRNAFTSYAGTSLSEPSIFAGALLLHSHYPRPFSRENSLLKLTQVDGYKFLVSDDPILRQLLDPTDPTVKLDKGKAWNEVEFGDTLRQLQPYLDSQAADRRPIFLYTQPQNVHQGTSNRLVEMEREHWQYRAGFDKVTTYRVHEIDGIFGRFINGLKTRGIYDNSIVILTSDHGDGFDVCHGHNIEICPEVLRVPLIFHLPSYLRKQVVFDEHQIATPTDIMPSLFYLLGHRPIEHHMILGRPLFTNTREELESYRRKDVFFVSDARAAYGLLLDNGHYMYLTYDSPAQSFYFDLSVDPYGRHNIITPENGEQCKNRLVEYLFTIGRFYGYPPTGGRDGI